ncbi:MAG: hypothetical protein ACLP07_02970 [Terracidiphilus sp.]
MKFNVKALALGCAILWGGAVLAVLLVNLGCTSYAQNFLELMASIYPGYHANHSVVQVLIGTLYATADGLIGGAAFGWLYNRIAKTAS